jgi:hypothetical protein
MDHSPHAIFGIVSVLVIKDRTEATGRFSLASGALATMVGIGAAVSTASGGLSDSTLELSSLVSEASCGGGDRLCSVIGCISGDVRHQSSGN